MPESFSPFQTILFGLMKDITSAYVLSHGHNSATMFFIQFKNQVTFTFQVNF